MIKYKVDGKHQGKWNPIPLNSFWATEGTLAEACEAYRFCQRHSQFEEIKITPVDTEEIEIDQDVDTDFESIESDNPTADFIAFVSSILIVGAIIIAFVILLGGFNG